MARPVRNIAKTFDLQRRITRHKQFAKLSGTAARLWFDLWHYHNMGDDALIFPCRKEMAENLNVTPRSITGALAELQSAGLLQRTGETESGVQVFVFTIPDWLPMEAAVHPPSKNVPGGVEGTDQGGWKEASTVIDRVNRKTEKRLPSSKTRKGEPAKYHEQFKTVIDYWYEKYQGRTGGVKPSITAKDRANANRIAETLKEPDRIKTFIDFCFRSREWPIPDGCFDLGKMAAKMNELIPHVFGFGTGDDEEDDNRMTWRKIVTDD
jgi:DNA-binding MarR family transcriptional regulator